MIHIVFNTADAGVLEKVFELDQSIAGDIIEIKDDYAVGPLLALEHSEGWQARRDWWRHLLETTSEYAVDDTLDMVQDKMTLHQVIKKLTEDPTEIIWIWAAQNKHDVCGYYWLISQLAEMEGRVFILYLNNLPFINEKGGLFYPNWLSEIPPKEFLKAKKLARPVTPSEFEIDADEWKRLCHDNSMVRLLEGGKKIIGKSEDFFDEQLTKYITGDFQRGSKILQQFFAKEKETTGDVYVLWRLKFLATNQGWECRGELSKSSKDFELRNPLMPSAKKKKSDADDDSDDK